MPTQEGTTLGTVSNADNPTGDIHYNPLFENLVINAPDGSQVRGMIAYGLYKRAKWEWASRVYEKEGRKPSEAELQSYIQTWTPTQIDNIQNGAAQILTAYADAVLSEGEPGILKEALKGSFWRSLWTNLLSAAAYTLILILLALGLALAGIDILGVFEKFAGDAAHTQPTTPPPPVTTPQ